ncbi:MAG: hypothetical protein L0099_07285 [Acidobacteria bacterium]|nr:hypothetical protein [Acidobacteriota bacterium]
MSPTPQKHVPVSYNIITRGEPEGVLRCIDSVYGALYKPGDECVVVDTGSTQKQLVKLRKKLAKFPDAKLYELDLTVDFLPYLDKWLPEYTTAWCKARHGDTRCIMSFAQAREVARLKSRNPVCFWIDSDDVLVENRAGTLRAMIDKMMDVEKPQHETLFLEYQYSFGEDGTCTTSLKRERVFFRDRSQWKGACHEVVIPSVQRSGACAFFQDCGVAVAHRPDGRPSILSDVRNYVILRNQIENEGCKDPRTIFYLGNAARGLGRYKEAIDLYLRFDPQSGSADDRFSAHYYVAGLYLTEQLQRPHDAIKHYERCMEIDPFRARTYFGLARANAQLARWDRTIHFTRLGEACPRDRQEVHSYDPTHDTYHPYIVAANACNEIGQFDQAIAYARRLLAARPNHKEARELFGLLTNNAAGGQLAGALSAVGAHFRHGGPNARRLVRGLLSEMHATPPQLEDGGLAPPEDADPRGTALPEVAFYCPGKPEPWGPASGKTGIGGSEKMVILLSAALQATGRCRATVYAAVPHEQRGLREDTGVLWRHYAEFDETRPRDTFVAWRSPSAVTLGVPARKRIIWCHDVQDPASYDAKVLACTDAVQVQSEFHAAPLRGTVPEQKLWVARNGIVRPIDRMVERNPKLVLYCSSPDRGLYTAARIVREARKEDPDIQLVVAYGITPYARKAYARDPHRYCAEWGRDTSMDLYEQQLFTLLDEIGARVIHRVGFDMLETVMQGCGIWLYPTRFPEISCMSAMEAMANGCVPVATRHGALNETLPEKALYTLDSIPDSGEASEEWVKVAAGQLVDAVTNADDTYRVMLAERAINKYEIGALAEEWLRRLGISADGGGPRNGKAGVPAPSCYKETVGAPSS